MWSRSNSPGTGWNSYANKQQIPSPKSHTLINWLMLQEQKGMLLSIFRGWPQCTNLQARTESADRVSWHLQVKSMSISSQQLEGAGRQVPATSEHLTWVTADESKHYSSGRIYYWPGQEKIMCCHWSISIRRPPMIMVRNLPLLVH